MPSVTLPETGDCAKDRTEKKRQNRIKVAARNTEPVCDDVFSKAFLEFAG